MKANKRINKLALFFTISIIEMLVIAGFYGYKVYQIASTSKALTKYAAILKQKTAEAEIANDLEKQKIEKETEITKLKSKIFNDDSLFSFLQNLYDTALVYNLNIQSIAFGSLKSATSTTPPVQELPVNISIAGQNYENLINFFSYLEKKGFSIKCNSLSYSGTVAPVNSKVSYGKRLTLKKQMSASFIIYVQTNSNGQWSYESNGK